jgi:hypothetical protein
MYIRSASVINLVLLTGLLSGCVTGPAGVPPNTRAPVSAAQAALTAAGRTVLACYGVPACAKAAPKAQVKAAYDSAYDAVVQAQAVADAGGSPDLTATVATMAVLQGLVAQLPVTH